MVKRNTEPELIEVDWGTFRNGSVDVLVHWNIVAGTASDESGKSFQQWDYEESRIRVPLPAYARSLADAQAYLAPRYNALLMIAGADVIPIKIADLEAAVLDLAGVLL